MKNLGSRQIDPTVHTVNEYPSNQGYIMLGRNQKFIIQNSKTHHTENAHLRHDKEKCHPSQKIVLSNNNSPVLSSTAANARRRCNNFVIIFVQRKILKCDFTNAAVSQFFSFEFYPQFSPIHRHNILLDIFLYSIYPWN